MKIPIQAIIFTIAMTLACIVSAVCSFTFGERVLAGDDNRTTRGTMHTTYILCAISCLALTIGFIVMRVRAV